MKFIKRLFISCVCLINLPLAGLAFGDEDLLKTLDLDCKPGFNKLLETVKSMPNIKKDSESDQFVSYILDFKNRTFNFVVNKPGQFAYPALYKRVLYRGEDGSWEVSRALCCYSTKENCDKLMVEFDKLDAQMKAQMKGRGQ